MVNCKLGISKRFETLELIKCYFAYRNSMLFGEQNYYFWRRMIEYITGLKDSNTIRGLFKSLVTDNIFILKFSDKKYARVKYLYNPNGLKKEKEIFLMINRGIPMGTVIFE